MSAAHGHDCDRHHVDRLLDADTVVIRPAMTGA
jgi:hypothetical protein